MGYGIDSDDTTTASAEISGLRVHRYRTIPCRHLPFREGGSKRGREQPVSPMGLRWSLPSSRVRRLPFREGQATAATAGETGGGEWPDTRHAMPRPTRSLPRPHAIELLFPQQEQLSAGGRGRRVIRVVEVVDGQDVELGTGLDHVALSGVGEEQ